MVLCSSCLNCLSDVGLIHEIFVVVVVIFVVVVVVDVVVVVVVVDVVVVVVVVVVVLLTMRLFYILQSSSPLILHSSSKIRVACQKCTLFYNKNKLFKNGEPPNVPRLKTA